MGALLSLPLLAVPSLGTVSWPGALEGSSTLSITDQLLAYDLWSLMLRSGHLLSSMQFLRQISEQVLIFEDRCEDV